VYYIHRLKILQESTTRNQFNKNREQETHLANSATGNSAALVLKRFQSWEQFKTNNQEQAFYSAVEESRNNK
jgi:hypothetical protein